MAQTVQARITAAQYAHMPETNMPTELIDGEVIEMPSPKTDHQRISRRLFNLVQKLANGGELFYAPMDVYLDDLNVVQPDLFWVSGSGSLCQLGDDGYWHGAPDLVIEILSEGTGLRDRREKFVLYEAHGSREYWLVEPGPKFVEVWTRAGRHFKRRGVFGAQETFESPVLGGVKVELKNLFEK